MLLSRASIGVLDVRCWCRPSIPKMRSLTEEKDVLDEEIRFDEEVDMVILDN